MSKIVVAPYGKEYRHYFAVTERTGADFFTPTWQAGESRFTKETPVDTWSALADTALPVVHPQLADHFGVLFSATDLTCRRLIHRIKDVTATKAFNDDSYEIRTEGHHNAFYRDALLHHAGAVQAVGAASITLENTPRPVNVPPGSLVKVTDNGGLVHYRLAGSTYDNTNGLLSLSTAWGTLPTLPAEYVIIGAPEVPTSIPVDLYTVDGDRDAAIGLKWSGRQIIPTQVVAGTLTVNQFSTALVQTVSDFYKPRAFYFDGGALHQYMGVVESYDFVGGKGLISPKWSLPLIPSAGDKVNLM